MAKLVDIGEARQIEIEGMWSLRPSLGNFVESRRIVAQYLCVENGLWFYHAEDRKPLSAASGASIWQMFSTEKSRGERGRQLMPTELKKLGELLKSKGDRNHFRLYSASLRLMGRRMVLHVQGTEIETQLEHNCVLVPKRTIDGWVCQELGFRFPRFWHKKTPLPGKISYEKLIGSAWGSIEWNEAMPPLYVPSKVVAAAVLQPVAVESPVLQSQVVQSPILQPAVF